MHLLSCSNRPLITYEGNKWKLAFMQTGNNGERFEVEWRLKKKNSGMWEIFRETVREAH